MQKSIEPLKPTSSSCHQEKHQNNLTETQVTQPSIWPNNFCPNFHQSVQTTRRSLHPSPCPTITQLELYPSKNLKIPKATDLASVSTSLAFSKHIPQAHFIQKSSYSNLFKEEEENRSAVSVSTEPSTVSRSSKNRRTSAVSCSKKKKKNKCNNPFKERKKQNHHTVARSKKKKKQSISFNKFQQEQVQYHTQEEEGRNKVAVPTKQEEAIQYSTVAATKRRKIITTVHRWARFSLSSPPGLRHP